MRNLLTRLSQADFLIFGILGRSSVGFRWEFDRILPCGVLYLISRLKLVFLYLIKLINNLIKTLIRLL